MPNLIDPAAGFSLADMPGTLPDNLPPGQPAPTPEPEIAPEPTPTPEPEPEPDATTDEPAPEPEKKEEDDAPVSLNEAMDRQVKKTKDAEQAAAAEKKAAEEKAATEEAAKPAEKPARDADLDKIQLAPQAHERTRKVLNEVKAHAKTARDEADLAKKEANDLRQRVADLEEKSKSAPVPKELEEKLKQYEERIRELDISKDPELESKYDAKITKNNTAIVDVLKQFQYDKMRVKEGDVEKLVDNPRAIPELLKSGLSLKTMKPLIDKLNQAGHVEEADTILEAIRENNRLSRDKQAEVETWKSGYEGRIKQRDEQSKQALEARSQSIAKHRDEILNRDVEQLAKDLPFMNQPAAPQPNDPPAVVKAKQAQQAEYAAATARVKATIATLDTSAAPKEKFAEVAGRVAAYATQAVILREHAIPRLIKQATADANRIKELEAELGKIRGAGKLSRIQGAAPSSNGDRGRPEPQSLDEALGSGPQ